MTQENFEQFRLLVLQKIALQEQLRIISDAEEFFVRVVELGKENGFDFAVENVKQAFQENQRIWIERWI
jgi:Nif11 domain